MMLIQLGRFDLLIKFLMIIFKNGGIVFMLYYTNSTNKRRCVF